MIFNKNIVVAVVGLGYVGLPLAVEFGKKFKTIGFDLSSAKLANFNRFFDPTGQVTSSDLRATICPDRLELTNDPSRLSIADFLIITVPTPVDQAQNPDFSFLIGASKTVGQYMKANSIVIYESTVYPGATEEVCIPILERESRLKWKVEFHVGYSPERVNPGDVEHTITNIIKVVSGDDGPTLTAIAALYGSVINAGIHCVSSIRVAEAAKVIENTQRDLNIALMNELAIIFDKLHIDTIEVLEAAGTKWNFLNFRPGLVGGHCIGVDPYYLTFKSEMLGYHPQVIQAGRRINDGMATYVAHKTIKRMIDVGLSIKGAKVIVLGLTYKENCPDLRNSKVADLVKELKEFGCEVFVHDPIANSEEALQEYGILLSLWENLPKADVIIASVSHQYYLDTPLCELLLKLNHSGVFVDIKSTYPYQAITDLGYHVWRL